MQQQRQQPVEGNNESEAQTPTRTGDNVVASNITPREAKTMASAPIIFGVLALVVAIIVAIILFALK